MRRGFRNGGGGVQIVGAGRAGVDPARDAVLQAQRGAPSVARGVRVNVDQAWDDELAAGVERSGRRLADGRLHGRDAACRDPYVAHGVEPPAERTRLGKSASATLS